TNITGISASYPMTPPSPAHTVPVPLHDALPISAVLRTAFFAVAASGTAVAPADFTSASGAIPAALVFLAAVFLAAAEALPVPWVMCGFRRRDNLLKTM